MVCNRCTAEFAIGVRMCPQCTAEDAHEKGPEDDMAKITHGAGATDVNQEGAEGWDGTSTSASSAMEPKTSRGSELPDQSPAPTAENPSETDQTEPGSTAASTGGESPSTPESEDQADADESGDEYDDWSYAELQAEAKTREGMAATGTTDDLKARLREDDKTRDAQLDEAFPAADADKAGE